MLKIFLVEDEFVVREGIKNNIDWAKEGFIFSGEAADGELAFPLIQAEQPDIIITDIIMPNKLEENILREDILPLEQAIQKQIKIRKIQIIEMFSLIFLCLKLKEAIWAKMSLRRIWARFS